MTTTNENLATASNSSLKSESSVPGNTTVSGTWMTHRVCHDTFPTFTFFWRQNKKQPDLLLRNTWRCGVTNVLSLLSVASAPTILCTFTTSQPNTQGITNSHKRLSIWERWVLIFSLTPLMSFAPTVAIHKSENKTLRNRFSSEQSNYSELLLLRKSCFDTVIIKIRNGKKVNREIASFNSSA